LLSAVLLVGSAVVVAFGLLWWTAAEQTALAIGQSEKLAHTGLDLHRRDLANLAVGHAAWIEVASEAGDAMAAYARIVGAAYQRAAIDQAYILDADGRIVFARIDGEPVRGLVTDHLRGGLPRLIEAVRGDRMGAQRTGFLLADGQPAMVAVAALTAGVGSFLVYVQVLETGVIQDLAQLYPLPALRLRSQGGGAAAGTLDSTSVDGMPLGSLRWRIDRPGDLLLTRVGPPLGVALLGLVALGWMVVRHSREIGSRLQHWEARALEDALTGLPNRRLLDDRLAQALARLKREPGLVALLFVDLDHFKQVNDTFGHETGDRVLAEVSTRMRGIIRSADTVARLGGDEFAVLMVGIRDAGEAALMAHRLIASLRHPIPADGRLVKLTVSIGIGLAPADATEGRELLRAADRALYRAKAEGRGSFRFYETLLEPAGATPVWPASPAG
jgi:diguanylate cyclase (GGDEF)-like protein